MPDGGGDVATPLIERQHGGPAPADEGDVRHLQDVPQGGLLDDGLEAHEHDGRRPVTQRAHVKYQQDHSGDGHEKSSALESQHERPAEQVISLPLLDSVQLFGKGHFIRYANLWADGLGNEFSVQTGMVMGYKCASVHFFLGAFSSSRIRHLSQRKIPCLVAGGVNY